MKYKPLITENTKEKKKAFIRISFCASHNYIFLIEFSCLTLFSGYLFKSVLNLCVDYSYTSFYPLDFKSQKCPYRHQNMRSLNI